VAPSKFLMMACILSFGQRVNGRKHFSNLQKSLSIHYSSPRQSVAFQSVASISQSKRCGGTTDFRNFSIRTISKSSELSSNNEGYIYNGADWRTNPSLNETYYVPSVILPSKHVHSMMQNKGGENKIAPFLASHMKEFENLHPRIKLVRDLESTGSDSDGNRKAILLDNRICMQTNSKRLVESEPDPGSEICLSAAFPGMSIEAVHELASKSATPGPIFPIAVKYTQQPLQHILSKLLPEEAQPPPTGFEQIGHVVHLNLKAHHVPYKELIGSVILDLLSPKIETVVNKVGEVCGPFRTYDMEVLAGKPDTTVKLNEDGVHLEFDLRNVYWCTRLSGERSRLLSEINKGEIIADAFCGVGAFCLLAASKLGCTVYANDLNPAAVLSCRESAKKNLKRSAGSVTVNCGDAFDFIQNLGSLSRLPDHVIMNFPLDSASFLGVLRWWPVLDDMKDVNFHLYTFARGDDPTGDCSEDLDDKFPPRDASEVAIDLVADGLLPEGGAIEASRNRRSLLDRLGCKVKTTEVRDVAPGKVVICVSFRVTKALLKVMQGDFIDF